MEQHCPFCNRPFMAGQLRNLLKGIYSRYDLRKMTSKVVSRVSIVKLDA